MSHMSSDAPVVKSLHLNSLRSASPKERHLCAMEVKITPFGSQDYSNKVLIQEVSEMFPCLQEKCKLDTLACVGTVEHQVCG